jgi:hypothetical protein
MRCNAWRITRRNRIYNELHDDFVNAVAMQIESSGFVMTWKPRNDAMCS